MRCPTEFHESSLGGAHTLQVRSPAMLALLTLEYY